MAKPSWATITIPVSITKSTQCAKIYHKETLLRDWNLGRLLNFVLAHSAPLNLRRMDGNYG